MYNSNLIGGISAWLSGTTNIIWNIRHTDFGPEDIRGTAFWSSKICTSLSRWIPTSIICCSEASKSIHIQAHYSKDKMIVIPNGVNLKTYRPEPTARQSVLDELGLPKKTLLIGLIARFHPQKDHLNFIQSASMLSRDISNAHFLLCGKGVTWDNQKLNEWITDTGVGNRFHRLMLANQALMQAFFQDE